MISGAFFCAKDDVEPRVLNDYRLMPQHDSNSSHVDMAKGPDGLEGILDSSVVFHICRARILFGVV